MSSKSVGFAIDDDQPGAVALGHQRKPAAGQTTSDEPIARNRSQASVSACGAPHRVFRHRLTERDGRGLDEAAARRAIRRAAVGRVQALAHPRQFVALLAIEAEGVGRVAVQLDDVFGCNARGLMQIIDVLRDHRRHLAGAVEAGQRPMSAPGWAPAELRRPWRSAAARIRCALPGWPGTRRTGSAGSWSTIRPASGNRGCRIRSRCRRR